MTLKIDVARQQATENWTAQEVQDLFRLVEKFSRSDARRVPGVLLTVPLSSPGQMRQVLRASRQVYQGSSQ
jgi:hypothetical protein